MCKLFTSCTIRMNVEILTLQINILVTTDGEACISDFGLSRHIDSVTASTAVHGSMRWRAPELCLPDQYGLTVELAHRLPSDVWSFGMTVLVSNKSKFPNFLSHNSL